MQVSDFLERLECITGIDTLYVMGGWGQPLTVDNKEQFITAYVYNQKTERMKMIRAANGNTFAFDCSGLVKSVLWGFTADFNDKNGGADYGSWGVPDTNAAGLIAKCSNVSGNMGTVSPGELLYMRGHCGVYKGNGQVFECSPKWENRVQVTELSARKWEKHGFLPWVEYEQTQPPILYIPASTLRMGSRGMRVQQLQECLNHLGAGLVVDAIYGPKTRNAVADFQTKNNIIIDGIYGPQTKSKLMEVLWHDC